MNNVALEITKKFITVSSVKLWWWGDEWKS